MCSADISDTAKFCPKCGIKIESEKVEDIGKKKCPSCGAKNLVSAKFCKNDGYNFQQVEERSVEKPTETEKQKDIIVCPQCGTPHLLTAKFCMKDGTPLKEEEKPSIAVKPEVETKVAFQSKVREVTKKPSRFRILVPVLGLVLIIIAGVVAGYFMGRKSRTEQKPAEVAKESEGLASVGERPQVVQPQDAEVAKESEGLVTPPEEKPYEEVKPPSSDYKAIVRDPDGFVNVRSGPGTNFSIIGRVNNDETVYLKEQNGAWWLLDSPYSGGFIHQSRLVLNIKPPEKTSPVEVEPPTPKQKSTKESEVLVAPSEEKPTSSPSAPSVLGNSLLIKSIVHFSKPPYQCYDNIGGGSRYGQSFIAKDINILGIRVYIGDPNRKNIPGVNELCGPAFLILYKITENSVIEIFREKVVKEDQIVIGEYNFIFTKPINVIRNNKYILTIESDDTFGIGLTNLYSSTFSEGEEVCIDKDGNLNKGAGGRDISFIIYSSDNRR